MRPGSPTNKFSGKQHDLARSIPVSRTQALRPTGPVDPDVPVLAVQTHARPPAGERLRITRCTTWGLQGGLGRLPIVCNKLQALVKERDSRRAALERNERRPMADGLQPARRREYTIDGVAGEVAQAAGVSADPVSGLGALVMQESLLEVGVRMPNVEEMQEAREAVEAFTGRSPKTLLEVYARETVILSEMPPTRELKLQALRIGELGIAAIPNEVFSITGLTIKRRSPLKQTFTIELANGCEGYIPPPDQHALGGYETWRARSSCLEERSEVQIVSKTCSTC